MRKVVKETFKIVTFNIEFLTTIIAILIMIPEIIDANQTKTQLPNKMSNVRTKT